MKNSESVSTQVVRVRMPPEDSLEIQLLPSTVIARFEEYKADENLAYLVLGICGSGIIDLMIDSMNITTGISTYPTIIGLSVLLLGLILALVWTFRIRSRINLLKKRHDIR